MREGREGWRVNKTDYGAKEVAIKAGINAVLNTVNLNNACNSHCLQFGKW